MRNVILLISLLVVSTTYAKHCDAEMAHMCRQAYDDICIQYESTCDNEGNCLLDVENLYQEALQTIYETTDDDCECEMTMCTDWTNAKHDARLKWMRQIRRNFRFMKS